MAAPVDARQARITSFDWLLAALVGPALLLDLAVGLSAGHYTDPRAYGGLGRFIGLGSGWLALLPVVTGTIAAFGVVVRNRFPWVAMFAVPGASLAVSVAMWLSPGRAGRVFPEAAVACAMALVLVSAVRRQPPVVAVAAVAAAGAAILAACTIRLGTDGTVQAVAAVLGLLLLTIAIGLGLYQRWLDWTRSRATEGARRDERVALARELHDVVAHHVTGIVVQAQAARFVIEQDPSAASRSLEAIEQAGSEALASMRTMVGALRADGPAPAAPTAGVADIGRLVDEARAGGHPVSVEVDPALGPLPDALSGAAYRIVQESLTNVRRHAQPNASVWVRLARAGGDLEVWVANDGHPRAGRARVTEGGGYGLVGMRERVTSLGGTLAAGPTGGARPGWGVRALLPLRQGGS